MGRTICHTVHTYFFPKHQYIMNLSPTDQLFSHIVGHTEKLLCRGVRFVLLCCDIPDLFHSPIENRTKERKTGVKFFLEEISIFAKKIVFHYLSSNSQICISSLISTLASNKWSNQKKKIKAISIE